MGKAKADFYGGDKLGELARATCPPRRVLTCAHSPARQGSPTAARAQCHPLCRSINILFTISPIFTHYLSPAGKAGAPSQDPVPLSGTGLPPSLGSRGGSWETAGWGLQVPPEHTWRGFSCRWVKSPASVQSRVGMRALCSCSGMPTLCQGKERLEPALSMGDEPRVMLAGDW